MCWCAYDVAPIQTERVPRSQRFPKPARRPQAAMPIGRTTACPCGPRATQRCEVVVSIYTRQLRFCPPAIHSPAGHHTWRALTRRRDSRPGSTLCLTEITGHDNVVHQRTIRRTSTATAPASSGYVPPLCRATLCAADTPCRLATCPGPTRGRNPGVPRRRRASCGHGGRR
jgi:hypothetical protein